MKMKTTDVIEIDYHSLDSAIKDLIAAKEKLLNDGCTHLDLEVVHNDYEGVEITVSGVRFETDAEEAKRLEREDESRKWRQRQYEELKKEGI